MLSKLRSTTPFVLMISVLLLCACSNSNTKKSTNNAAPTLQNKLQAVADNAVQSGLPGVTLHVQRNDEHIEIVAGVSNQFSEDPLETSTLFHAASVGKTFTATMILRMIDMNLLQLDDTIDHWLDPSISSIVTRSDQITVEMLISHTSGLQDYFQNIEFLGTFLESAGRVWSPLEILSYLEGTDTSFEPGTDFSYSNTNYLLLGVIAERVSGLPIGDAMREWVLAPAGLENTYGVFENLGQPFTGRGYLPKAFVDSVGIEIPVPAVGTDLDSTKLINSEGLGDAPIQSTAGDLNKFIRTLIDTDRLLPRELRDRMTNPLSSGVSPNGLGLFIEDEGSRFGHDGKGFGVHSIMTYSPEKDLSFATIVNGSFGNYDSLYNQYLEQVFRVIEEFED